MSGGPRVLPTEPLAEIIARHGGLREVLRPKVTRQEYDRIQKALREGRITIATADLAAVRLGFHPGRIWPEWFSVIDVEEGRIPA